MPNDFNIMVGGEAGQGVQSIGFMLAKVFARGGFNVFADQDYESRIRGGHNFFRVRISESCLDAIAEKLKVLIALDKNTIDIHRQELTSDGIVLFDGDSITGLENEKGLFRVPFSKLAETETGNAIMANTVAFGAVVGLIGYDLNIVNDVLKFQFGKEDVTEKNIKAAKAGYDYVQRNYKGNSRLNLKPLDGTKGMLLSGNEAIALGAMAAGCKFMAAYPMTPTTPIMEYFAAKAKDYDLVLVQAEDEIAAIHMVVGAAYAGVRAMTATSGGGFCLMVEGLGLAGMTETPIVVVEGQRAGPAIGLPTRTEQGDLEFIIHASHGEFPRAVLAPATVENAFWCTVKAFNLAEKYQIPVLIVTDHHLASCYSTVEKFDLSRVAIERGQLYDDKEPAKYKRHLITDSGISPRAFPMLGKSLVVTDSDEHDEIGHPIEDAEARTKMVQKRMRKILSLKQEIVAPEIHGSEKADLTLVSWGSTYGAAREAVDSLNREKVSVNLVNLSEIWPFPAEAMATLMKGAKKTCVIESNATGQLAHLISAETGSKVSDAILKYDGRPITSEYIIRELNKGGLV